MHEPDNKRILSIQSHVVHGYAGNKCSVFPLQLHGYEVDFINSVQFSNHTAYDHVSGQRLGSSELRDLYAGLKANSINHYSHIMTGYCGDASFLNEVGDIVADVRRVNPDVIFASEECYILFLKAVASEEKLLHCRAFMSHVSYEIYFFSSVRSRSRR
ncbi:hypothetical protein AB6A40_010602 [Gnathostoma spinigerum]|uniref:pyridoxal kinase n=1 Tax=Gnathostoma spinigerum TaxID=75299 RepID=A0ABD6F220_9BILA